MDLRRKMITESISKGMKLAICVFSVVFSGSVTGQIVTTIAGNGTYGLSGDGGVATSAKLAAPAQVVLDASGNIFIADAENHRIRKVSTSGTITTVAGADSAGFSGDGSAATNARLNGPYGLAVDATGNVFIADYYNNRIRKVNTSGVIRTIAGTGTAGYSGDGSAATGAKLNGPCGVAVDAAGNVYIADINNGRIRKVSTSGVITTVAGVGTFGNSGDGGQATNAQIATPYGVSLDASGNIYIVDYFYAVVRKVSPSGVITRVAGIGTAGYSGDGAAATSAALRNPLYVAADNSGNLFIADYLNYVVRKVSPSGVISTVAGSGSSGFSGDGGNATGATFTGVACVAVDASGNLYIADESNNRIRKVTANRAPVYRNAGGTASVCQNAAGYPLTELLAVKDLDAAQTITWSVVTAPAHGTAVIAGTRPSNGFIVRPVGTSYTPNAGYSGVDTMVLRVSDGIVATTATFYLNVNALPAVPVISGATAVCHGGTATLIASPSGGVWSSMDGNATVGASTGIITGVGGPVGVISYLSPYNAYGCRSQVRTTIPILSYPAAGTITGSSIVCPGSTTSLSESVTGGTWTSSNTALATISASGAVTGVSSGALTISYTVSNSCFSAMATTPMTVGGATNPSVIAGGTYVCIGSTITYSNALSGGSWSSTNTSVANVSGSGVVSPVAVGTATIIYSYTNGCGITRTASKAITVYDLPNTGTVTGPSTVTRGAVLSLTTSGITSGTWYRSTSSSSVLLVSGSGTTGRVYGVAPGTANVYYTASNTCGTATSSYALSVTAGRSENGSVVAEGTEGNDIAVFPNPTSGIVTVQIPGTGSSDINVTDMSGKVVVMQSATTNKSDLDLSRLSPGIYQITVNNGVQVFTSKVVLK